ncbi:MAG: hypothetical protein A3C22_03010 [Candidatus Levybacteria bacterium RIFCSPHIGHO2_02_FULL_37_10]|nr:MAG: hypothetical protein A3C22_03010 [Candidatus Levybacteria bacterium RIFCSPHIGHO2_02_FULL_37_10]OGH41683.1 MAG: hypothetical protein A3H79_04765 [Candidatus Levybacteria bacterium RIFCSPLOWO2_02_FULL_36_8b]
MLKKTARKKNKFLLYAPFVLIFLFFLLFFYAVRLYLPSIFNKSAFVSPIAFSIKEKIGVLSGGSSNKELENLLSQKNIAFSSISVLSDSSYLVKLSTGEEIIFSGTKAMPPQVSSLQLILSRLTIEGKRFVRLDFRFDKPVVTFK